MKWSRTFALAGLCLLTLGLALSILATGLALAQEGTAIDWWVVGGGGGPVTSGKEISIDATLGQPIIGPSGADAVLLGAGYWYAGSEPTAVRLLNFQATASGRGILVTWETATEVDNLGFDLFRRIGGQDALEKLNGALIPSESPGGVIGQSYEWFDTAVRAGLSYTYILEDVDVYGQRNRHGPVEATAHHAIHLPLVLRGE